MTGILEHLHRSEREWRLAEHIRAPRRSWRDAGLIHTRAIPTLAGDTDAEDAPDAAHPVYHGVYVESLEPRRYYWMVVCNGQDQRGYGFTSPAKAARAYDAFVRAWQVDAPLNFTPQGRDVREAS